MEYVYVLTFLMMSLWMVWTTRFIYLDIRNRLEDQE